MKITKSHLRRIIKEELELDNFNQEVKETYCEHVLLNYPTLLLSEGYINIEVYNRAIRMKTLNESNRFDYRLQEGFFDDVKAMAKKVGGKALDRGKKLGAKALARAKEIGDTEIDVKGARKEMGRVGREAGELAAGAGEAILNFIGPMADKLGNKARFLANRFHS